MSDYILREEALQLLDAVEDSEIREILYEGLYSLPSRPDVSLQIKEVIGKKIEKIETIKKNTSQEDWKIQLDAKIFLLQELLSEIEHTNSEWIPVSERLPEDGQIVTAYNSIGAYSQEHFQDGNWVFYKTKHLPITHWMPLPPPPNK